MFKLFFSAFLVRNARTKDETKDKSFRNGLLIMGSMIFIVGLLLTIWIIVNIIRRMSILFSVIFISVIVIHISAYVFLAVITRPKSKKKRK